MNLDDLAEHHLDNEGDLPQVIVPVIGGLPIMIKIKVNLITL